MSIYEKLKLWKSSLITCINNIFKFNLEANVENLGVLYNNYISELKDISHIINNTNLDILKDELDLNLLDLFENTHNFLKKNIYLYLNEKIINYLKSQKLRSFSYSNNIENLSLEVNINIIKSDAIYIEIQELITNEFIILHKDEKFKNIIKRGALSLRIYLNDIIKKDIFLNRSKKYILLNVFKDISNNILNKDVKAINNIQLIHYPIKPIYIPNKELNPSLEINNLKIRFPNADFFTIYNIDPLINKKLHESIPATVVSALSEKIANKLKTIINVPLNKKYASYIELESNIKTNNELLVSDNYILKPAIISIFKKDEDIIYSSLGSKNSSLGTSLGGKNSSLGGENIHFSYYPFGGINLYAKKKLSIMESIILDNIKNDCKIKNTNETIKNRYLMETKKEIIKPVLYSLELLSVELIKEFKLKFTQMVAFLEKNDIELNFLHFFNFIFGNEYSNNIFIAKALKKIHNNEYNKFILSCQIMNPHLNISKLEKELIINQKLTIYENGLDIWTSIKNNFLKSNIFDRVQKLPKEEKYTDIKHFFKTIIQSTIEEKDKLECIPNSIKIYGIIHSYA